MGLTETGIVISHPDLFSPEIMRFGIVLSLVAIVLMLVCGFLITDTLLRILVFVAAGISIAALLVTLKKKRKEEEKNKEKT